MFGDFEIFTLLSALCSLSRRWRWLHSFPFIRRKTSSGAYISIYFFHFFALNFLSRSFHPLLKQHGSFTENLIIPFIVLFHIPYFISFHYLIVIWWRRKLCARKHGSFLKISFFCFFVILILYAMEILNSWNFPLFLFLPCFASMPIEIELECAWNLIVFFFFYSCFGLFTCLDHKQGNYIKMILEGSRLFWIGMAW